MKAAQRERKRAASWVAEYAAAKAVTTVALWEGSKAVLTAGKRADDSVDRSGVSRAAY